MNMLKMIAPAALAAMALGVPQAAQAESEWPTIEKDWVEVTGVKIDDGHELEYMQWLASDWRKSNEFAKSQGWINSYEIMWNSYPRKGEPDVYLVIRFDGFASPEENERRYEAYRQHMAMSDSEAMAESAGRAEYRHVQSSMLLRSQTWRK